MRDAEYSDEVWQQAQDWVMHLHESTLDAAGRENLGLWLQESIAHRKAYEQASALWLMMGLVPTSSELDDPS
ncbi:MAG: DUF4880 domain-containing protein [Cellvibrionaceae bacterium]|nr:DUF4880 domain-containing protein [Cellvibrionaceae bacterium]